MQKAWFLDRDGTMIVEKNYLGDPDEVVLLDGAVEALKTAQDAGYLLIVVTNQSGIARGYFSEEDADRVDQRLGEMLRGHGITITHTYRCPHHPEGKPPYNVKCNCRKPEIGLFQQAIEEYALDPAQCIACGDKERDIERLPELGIPEDHLGLIGTNVGEYPNLLAFYHAVAAR